MRRSPWRHLPPFVLAAAGLAWLGGFIWFAGQIPDGIVDSDSPTDAIVVLTGGALRVDNGLTLLAEGRAKKLFISGVYRSTDVKALLHAQRQEPDWLACCIVLGHAADNTRGNAIETAAWMQAENFHSLRLVTASYHMPRSLLEFARAMPEVQIVRHPVFPEGVSREWWASPHDLRLMLGEYFKYLVALARLEPEEASS
jgi:uncharacterized SAM-binding protein YcdF (DUF218 family)